MANAAEELITIINYTFRSTLFRKVVVGWRPAQHGGGGGGGMAGTQQGGELAGPAARIDAGAEGPEPSAAGEGKRQRQRLFLVHRLPRLDAVGAEPVADAARAQPPGLHAPAPGLAEGGLVDIAARHHALGQRREIGGMVLSPAAQAELARKIAEEARPCRLEALDIAQRQCLQAGCIERAGGLAPLTGRRGGHCHLPATNQAPFERRRRPWRNHWGARHPWPGSGRTHPVRHEMETMSEISVIQGPTPIDSGIPVNRGHFETLCHALDYAAEGRTGANFHDARANLVRAYPYRELRNDALAVARRLQARGLKPGDRVALIAETGPDFLAHFFGALYACVLPVPMPMPTSFGGRESYVEQLRQQLKSAEAALVVGPDGLLPMISEAADRDAPAMSWTGFQSLPESEEALPTPEADAIAYLQYSSGSTRFPHGVAVTHRAVLANLRGQDSALRMRRGDRVISWLPWYHDMGLVGCVFSPLAGQLSVDYLSTDDFARRPLSWLTLISRNPGTTLSYSPSFGYDICARRVSTQTDVSGKFDLSRWRVAGNGADMIRPDICQAFVDAFADAGFNAAAFTPSYGLAEATLAVTITHEGQGIVCDLVDERRLSGTNETGDPDQPVRYRAIVNCGPPIAEHRVDIRDEAGNSLPDREIGRVHVAGPSLMVGYFRDEAATRACLSEDGWLDTGDMGYLLDGHLYIVGRAKDMIILNGKNHWPQDIEWAIEQLEGFKAGDIAAFSITLPSGEETPAVLVQCRSTDAAERERLKGAIRQKVRQLTGMSCLVELVPPRTLPRTTSGKLSRSKARALYLAGEIVPLDRAA